MTDRLTDKDIDGIKKISDLCRNEPISTQDVATIVVNVPRLVPRLLDEVERLREELTEQRTHAELAEQAMEGCDRCISTYYEELSRQGQND